MTCNVCQRMTVTTCLKSVNRPGLVLKKKKIKRCLDGTRPQTVESLIVEVGMSVVLVFGTKS